MMYIKLVNNGESLPNITAQVVEANVGAYSQVNGAFGELITNDDGATGGAILRLYGISDLQTQVDLYLSSDGTTYYKAYDNVSLVDNGGVVSLSNNKKISDYRALLPTLTPSSGTTNQTAEQIAAADKAKYNLIVGKLKSGEQVDDDDSIFYIIGGSSVVAEAIMSVLDAGGRYNELVALSTAQKLKLTDTTIVKVLAIYLVKVDIVKFRNETGLSRILTYADLKSFVDYLDAQNITKPSLQPIINEIRSSHKAFTALGGWLTSINQ